MVQTVIRPVLLGLLLVSAVRAEVAPDKIKCAINDAQQAVSPDAIQLRGMIGARIDLSEQKRLLEVDEEGLLEGFRKKPGKQAWVGEHIGKWIHAATLAWVYSGDAKLRAKLDRVVAELIKTQGPDGYLGTYLEKHRWKSWDVWVHKYDLLGLLTYYKYTQNAASLEACRKIGDLLCATFGKDKQDIVKAGEHVGMAATSVLEPMVLLYRQTGDEKYLEFCRYILWSWEQPHGPKLISSLSAGTSVDKTANGKAYEMMSNLVGLCELYRTVGGKDLLVPVLNAWKDIVEKRLYITGTASQGEHFKDDYFLPNDPSAHVGENCVAVTWMQLNAQLLRLTGEARFADELERTVYNHLASAQKPTAEDWCYFTPLEGVKEYGHLGRQFNCCLSSGPRGLAMVPTFAYGTDADGVVVNFFENGRATLKLADGSSVVLEQVTLYPTSEESMIRLILKQPKRFAIRFRTPGWSDGQMFITKNRSMPDSGSAAEKGYQIRYAEWKNGDEIFVRFKMPVKVVAGDHTNAGKVALRRGPLVLAASDGINHDIGSVKNVALPAKAEALQFKPEVAKATLAVAKAGWRAQVKACRAPSTAPSASSEKAGQDFILHVLPFAEAGGDGSYYQVWFREGCASAKAGK